MKTIVAVIVFSLLCVSTRGHVCLKVSNTLVKRDGFSNPGLYNPAKLTDSVCRAQCWWRLKIFGTQLILGNFCFCGNWSMSNVASSNASCSSVCPGGAGLCGSVVDFTAISAYFGLDEIKNLNLSFAGSLSLSPPASFSNVTLTASWVNVNPRAAHNVTFNAYYDLDQFAYQTFFNAGNSTAVTLVSSSPGYHSVRGIFLNGDGIAFSKHAVVFVGQYFIYVDLVVPKAVQVNQPATFFLRICEQKDAQINMTYEDTSYSSPHIADTKPLTIGSVFETAANSTSASGFVSFIFGLTIREEAMLEQIRVNSHGSSCSVTFQVYRPYCAAGSYYCYAFNNCKLLTDLTCASPYFRKVNCSSGMFYKVSAQACSSGNKSFTPNVLTNAEFSNYFLFYETSNFALRGGYLVALNSPTTPVRLLLQPGDVPALYQTSYCFVSVMTPASFTLMIPTNSIPNFATRSTNFATSLGDPSTNFAIAGAGSPLTCAPLIELIVVKPVYFTKKITTRNAPACAASPMTCHSAAIYTVSYTLQNAYSSYSDKKTISVYLPITNVSISVPEIAISFQIVSIAAILGGSLPTYTFSVNDSSLPGNWKLSGDGNYSAMEFRHIFAASGFFNVSLLAANPLSSGSDSGVIQVLNQVADLSLWPLNLPGQKLGQPSTFLVSLSQASAANVTIDFGDGTVQSATVDDANVFVSNDPLMYFIAVNRVYPHAKSVYTNHTSLPDCLIACLSSTDFYCQAALYDAFSSTCQLYNSSYNPATLNINYQTYLNSTLFILKSDICLQDMVRGGRVASWNASSAVNQYADISLNGPGWVGDWNTSANASASVNQSLQIAFVAMTQIYAINVQPAANGKQVSAYTLLISNDSQRWTAYQNGSTFTSGCTTLRVPIVTRFLVLNVLSTGNANSDVPSLRLGLTGCAAQSVLLSFNHTYANLGLYNVTVNATNLVSGEMASNWHAVDTPIVNLSAMLLTRAKVELNASAFFEVGAHCGRVFRIYFTRNDNVTSLNMLQQTSQTNAAFFSNNYSVPTEKLGVFTYTVTLSNYLGSWTAAISGKVFLEHEVADFVVVGSTFGTFLSPATNIILSDLHLCVNATLPYPTETTLTVDYGDNSSVISTRIVCNSSMIGAALNACPNQFKFCVLIPPHSYTSYGTMAIGVQFFNDISYMSLNYTYVVWQTVSALASRVDVLPPFPQGMSTFDVCVPTNAILQFTALMASGSKTPFNLTWDFGDGSPPVNSTSLAVNYTYTVPNGGYVVRVSFSNPVSHANSTTVQTMLSKNYSSLCVQDRIVTSQLTFSNDGPAAINATMNFTFDISGTLPSQGCYLMDFADPQSPSRYTMWGNMTACNASLQFSSVLSKAEFYSYSELQLQNALPLNYTHAYYKLGRINALLYAANSVSSVSRTSPVVVTKYACRLPLVDVGKLLTCTNTNCDPAHANVVMFRRSATISIRSNVIIKCQASVLANYSWAVSVCNDTACVNGTAFSFTEHLQHYGPPTLTGFNLKTLSLKPRTFTPALYQVCLNVSMDGLEDLWTIDCGLFSVTPTPSLVSCINNSASVLSELFGVTNFTLDATCAM